jgi:hypothetical protein
MTLKRGLLYLLKIIVGLILIYAIFLAVVVYIFSPNHNIFKKDRFDKSLWIQDIAAGKLDNKLDCQRGRMTQDVIDNVLIKNLSKEDVVKLLGEPNSSGSMSFDYEIGWCTYIDPNSLRIDFDENRLVKAYILNH